MRECGVELECSSDLGAGPGCNFWTAIDVVNPACSTYVLQWGIEAKGGNMRYVLINGLAILSMLAVATETALAQCISVTRTNCWAGAPLC